MAKRKHRSSKNRGMSAAPGTRKHSKVRRRRRKHMGEINLPVVGKVSLQNPMLGGSAAGAIGKMLDKFTPVDTTDVVKIAIPYAAAFVAMKMKQPMLCAGLAAIGAYKATEIKNEKDEFVFPFLNDGMQPTKYANPALLMDDTTFYDQSTDEYFTLNDDEMNVLADAGLLSDAGMLSDGVYPNYQPLYENEE